MLARRIIIKSIKDQKCQYFATNIKRPIGARMAWGKPVLKELIPLTSELLTHKGHQFDQIGINYCRKYQPLVKSSRSISDSWLEIILPCFDHEDLRNSLLRGNGIGSHKIRYGNLFEIIDALAADVCYRHCGPDPVIVTASVDGMRSVHEIEIQYDLKIQGYLTYVGKSSMEVNINIINSLPNGDEVLVGETLFIMVARNRETGHALQAPILELEDEESKNSFIQGKQRAAFRRKRALESLTLHPPRAEEIEHIHKLYLDSRKLTWNQDIELFTNININTSNSLLPAAISPESLLAAAIAPVAGDTKHQYSGYRWMNHTIFKNTHHMHAQNRNIHGKMFGGYLIKMAYELAMVSAMAYLSTDDPIFVAVDDIQFTKSVTLGSIMDIKSTVVYSEGKRIVTKVVAKMILLHPEFSRTQTNTFVFVFEAPAHVKQIAKVIPREYKEFVLYLEGRRSLEKLTSSSAAAAIEK